MKCCEYGSWQIQTANQLQIAELIFLGGWGGGKFILGEPCLKTQVFYGNKILLVWKVELKLWLMP